jgi:hypothetical protein
LRLSRSGELVEIRRSGITAETEDLLTEHIEDRLTAIEVARLTAGDYCADDGPWRHPYFRRPAT